jgi:predicted permease
MAPGATTEAVANELNVLARRLPARFGGSATYARLIEQHRAIVRPLDQAILGDVKGPLWVLFAACGIVLLIACANVANLFMVRSEGRQRDLAVRHALGATRGELVRIQMAEAIVVAILAAALAFVIAAAALPAFLDAAPGGIPRLADVRITAATLLFTLAAAALAALACGVLPALRASAGTFARLRDGSRGATRGRHRGRDALVVAQTALALVLLIGSGLLVRSFWALRGVDAGYDTADLFTFQIAPERPSLSDGPSWARFQLDFMERLRALPGVQIVGLVENIPLNEGTAASRFHRDGIVGEPDSGPLLQFTFAAGDYFEAMGIEILEGRPFDAADHLQAPGHVIVSRSAAAALWPGQSAIGKRLQRQQQSGGGGSGIASTNAWDSVIGVVEDVLQYNFREQPDPLVYYPLVGPTPMSWAITSPAYVVKTPRAETIAADVRALVREVAPEAPMYRVYTMAGLAAGSMVDVSFTMLTLGVASALALVLGAAGLYGVLSFIVAERTREIGVRMALGAQTGQVLRMVVAQGARVVAAGVALGFAAAYWTTGALGTLLFGVAAVDPPTFAATGAGMVVVGLLASYVPARRASRVDPIVSLRAE